MIYIITLSFVVVLLVSITIYKFTQVKNQTDFMVAGRKLSWPVLVFTLLSSWIGAGSLLGGSENAYKHGLAALWQPAGGWLGLILIAAIAGRARHFAQFTVPDLLEARYNSHRPRVGHHRHSDFVRHHHELSIHRRWRHSSLDLSRYLSRNRLVDCRWIRHLLYRHGRYGIHRLS